MALQRGKDGIGLVVGRAATAGLASGHAQKSSCIAAVRVTGHAADTARCVRAAHLEHPCKCLKCLDCRGNQIDRSTEGHRGDAGDQPPYS